MSGSARKVEAGRFLGAVLLALVMLWPPQLLPDGLSWAPMAQWWWPAAYRPLGPIAVGFLLIVVHAASSGRGPGADGHEESIDASYFLGFVMTLVYLVFGLIAANATDADARWVLGFIEDLGVGLSFTVVGLTVRQYRALARPPEAPAPVMRIERGATAVQGVQELPESVAADLKRVLESVERALVEVDRRVDRVSPEAMLDTLRTFEQQVKATTASLGDQADVLRKGMSDLSDASLESAKTLRESWSTMRTTLTEHLSSLVNEAQGTVWAISQARQEALDLLSQSAKEVREVHDEARAAHRRTAEAWEEEMRDLQARVIAVRAAIVEEGSAALKTVMESSESLVRLGDRIVNDCNALPNPVERLSSLWGTIEAQEAKMVESIRHASSALESLRGHADRSGAELVKLAASVDKGSTDVATASSEMRDALAEEARAMRAIIDDLYAALERRIDAVGR